MVRTRRLAARLVVVALAIGGIGVASASSAAACSCAAEENFPTRLRNADAVFIGELAEIRPARWALSSSAPTRFIFEVDTVLKGEVYETQSVLSTSSEASCGIDLTVGGPYLVFSRADAGDAVSGMRTGELFTTACSGNRSTDLPDAADSAVLQPIPGSSPVGSYWVVGDPKWLVLGAGAVLAAVAVAVQLVRGRTARRSPER